MTLSDFATLATITILAFSLVRLLEISIVKNFRKENVGKKINWD